MIRIRAPARSAHDAARAAWAALSTPIAGPEHRGWRVVYYALLAMVAYLVAWCWWLTLRYLPQAWENVARAWRQ